MTVIRTIVVDDEPLAVQRIVDLLKTEKDVEVVDTCENGKQAVSTIKRLKPDLVFLDIQMPGLNGFEVINEVGVEQMPITVMVTAFDEYAVTAFEVNAMDYLLKPFDRDRFKTALNRVRRSLSRGDDIRTRDQMHGVMNTLADRNAMDRRILIKESGQIAVVDVDSIKWIESAGNYVKLFTGRKTFLYRQTLKRLQEQLEPFGFVRVHRTALVNSHEIESLRPLAHGDFTILLKNGSRLTLSRRFREQFEQQVSLPE